MNAENTDKAIHWTQMNTDFLGKKIKEKNQMGHG
jgi:hypothetical protein